MGASENTTGLILAVLSSGFIGTSFILKKKGLKKAAATTGYGAASYDGKIRAFSVFEFSCVCVNFRISEVVLVYGANCGKKIRAFSVFQYSCVRVSFRICELVLVYKLQLARDVYKVAC
uniref:Probable magnesium transporter NIPA6 n=1 Tax=Tanacetum cinerariifolium TaxID=118510 RepID=A0A699KF67_TANCI|nr:probable magnesium transporter NIPA6 [Tanacetum cinerariifolium]